MLDYYVMARIYYIPEPYPDELIGSLFVRISHHHGLSIKKEHRLLGLPEKSHWPLLFQKQIHLITNTLTISAEEILYNHTPFPYVTAFLAGEHTSRLASYYSCYQSQNQNSSALSQSASTGRLPARYCKACIDDDIRDFGEDYWHRRHNLPFVTRCWKHGTILNFVPRYRAGFSITGLPHEQQGIPVKQLFTEQIHSLLEPLSIALLESTFRQPTEEWQRYYRQIAAQRGFPHQGSLLSSVAVTNGFITYFGKNQLSRAGVEVPEKRNAWPAMLLRLNETEEVTAKHILMQVYLLNAPVPRPVFTTPPGRQSLNCQHFDKIFAAAIRGYVSKMERGTRTTVTQLLRQLSILQPVRHHREKLPLTVSAIKDFRRTEHSERQTGKRPRKKIT